MDYHLIQVTEHVQVPGPKGMTPEQEREWIAQYRKDHDAAKLEADYEEWRELLEQRERGELVSAEDVSKELGIDVEEKKEPA